MLQLNNIYIGDNLELLKQVDNNIIDFHICSPPYADMKKYDKFNGIAPEYYCEWIMPRIKEIDRTLKESGSFLLNINDKVENGFRSLYVFELILAICKNTNLKLYERLFWNKGKYLPNKYRFGDKIEYLFLFAKNKNFYFNLDAMRVEYDEKSIQRMKRPIKKRYCRTKENQIENNYKPWNPNPLGACPSTLISIGSEATRISDNNIACFPVKLCEYFIKGLSKENDIVCDIFSGTGSTCVAAKKLNRNFIGMDISELYVNESKKRLEKIEDFH
jgi:DNA modification methylase